MGQVSPTKCSSKAFFRHSCDSLSTQKPLRHPVSYEHEEASWKKTLKMTVGSFQNTPYWSIYAKIINRWIEESKFPLEFKNVQRIQVVRSPTLRKFGSLKATPIRSKSAYSTFGSDGTNDRASLLFDIAKANSIQINTGVSSFKKDVEAFLKKELSNPLHPARQLISVFLATFKSFFGNAELQALTNMAVPEELYQQIILPTKNFIDLVRRFTKSIYQEKLSYRSSEDFEDEETYFDQSIDQIVCDFIFRETSSTICCCIYRYLELKRKDELLYFEAIIKKYQEKSLQEIDSQVPEMYLLSNWTNPYQSVIDAIKLQRLIASPYMKREVLTTIEERIKNTINAYNQKEGKKPVSLIVEPDQKFAIYAYSLIKSDYKRVILDLDFIDEFARYGEQNQPYIHLKSCLQNYILSGEFEKYLLQHC